MDELSRAFNGRTVAKLSVQPQNPDGIGPVVVSIEFEGGGSLAVVTEQQVRAFIPGRGGSPGRPMTFTPVLGAEAHAKTASRP